MTHKICSVCRELGREMVGFNFRGEFACKCDPKKLKELRAKFLHWCHEDDEKKE